MARSINYLGVQRLYREQGVGGSISYENMARQSGVMVLRRQVIIEPRKEQAPLIEEIDLLTEEQLRSLASPLVEAEVELEQELAEV